MIRCPTLALVALATGCVSRPAAQPAEPAYTVVTAPQEAEPAEAEPGPTEAEPLAPAAADPVAAEPEPAVILVSAGARRPQGMTDFEAELAATVNRMRRDPAWLAARLARLRKNYEGDYLNLPGVDAPILTSEGTAAVDEAIAAARRSRSRPELRLSPGLNRAARAHAVEIGRDGSLEHSGRDGSEPHERMGRHGKVTGLSGENIGTGYGDGEVMALSLYIDDGVPGRGHRRNLLEADFRVFGVGCARHGRYGSVCVLDFAAGYRE